MSTRTPSSITSTAHFPGNVSTGRMRIRRSLISGLVLLAALYGCATQPTRGPVQVSASPGQAPVAPAAAETPMPNRPDSLKFAILGDFGTGSRRQLETAAEMARVRQRFPFDFVITVGDNIYGPERAQDFIRKFEAPYRPLLNAGVKFYASLGNHDSR